jgi:FkbM family methyltransferase
VTNLGLPGGLRVTLAEPVADVVLFGRPGQYVGERGALALAGALSREAGVFLDVGAHVGYFTFYVRCAARCPVPIHYFEPNPALYRQLARNVAASGLADVHGHPEALGARSGRARFHLNLSDPLSSSLSEEFTRTHRVEPIEVPVLTLADVVATHRLERLGLKVDVEGSEREFLAGARPVLDRVAFLVIEVLGPAVQEGFVQELRGLGFEAYYVNDRRLEHSPAGRFDYRPPQYNWLFCRHRAPELRRRLAGSGLTVR